MPFFEAPPTEIGCPIPANTPHAVSVTLPSWAANVGYEEGEEWVTSKMSSGYPRFFVHHKIQQLCNTVEDSYGREGEKCMIYPTYAVACRCRDFIKKYSTLPQVPVRIVQLSTSEAAEDDRTAIQARISVVFFPGSEYKVAKCYWQHTGEGISSRLGEYFLDHLTGTATNGSNGKSYKELHQQRKKSESRDDGLIDSSKHESKEQSTYLEERFGRNLDLSFAPAAKTALRRRIAGKITEGGQASHGMIQELSEDDVYLYPTGMTSIYSAHRALLSLMSAKSVCFGFPYIDTLKVLQKWGPGCHFYGNGDDAELMELEKLLESGEKILALF